MTHNSVRLLVLPGETSLTHLQKIREKLTAMGVRDTDVLLICGPLEVIDLPRCGRPSMPKGDVSEAPTKACAFCHDEKDVSTNLHVCGLCEAEWRATGGIQSRREDNVRTTVTDRAVDNFDMAPAVSVAAELEVALEERTEQERKLVMAIYDKTGRAPVINIEHFEDLIKRASVTYLYRNLGGEWHERSVEVSTGRGAEMLINALRGAVRGANLDHQSGEEAARSSGR